MTVKALKTFLHTISTGTITGDVPQELQDLLAECWHEFQGSRNTSMEAWKLYRMRDVEWSPPVLTFTVERHGAVKLGSVYAEIQGWAVDLDQRVAKYQTGKRKPIKERQPRLEAGPIVDELASRITAGEEDSRLKWVTDRRKVRVLVSEILPSRSASKQTLVGRRKRLREALKKRLEPDGWTEVAVWFFESG